MPIALSLLGGSAAVLLVLTVLFRKEAIHGERVFLSTARGKLDGVVLKIRNFWSKVFSHLGSGVFRATIHYIMHQFLGVIIHGLLRAQKKLFELHERHRKINKHVQEKSEGDPHLTAIAAHKEETALSETEKRKRRAHH